MKYNTITQEQVNAFLTAVGKEAFTMEEVIDKLQISNEEAICILIHLINNKLLKVTCKWIPEIQQEQGE